MKTFFKKAKTYSQSSKQIPFIFSFLDKNFEVIKQLFRMHLQRLTQQIYNETSLFRHPNIFFLFTRSFGVTQRHLLYTKLKLIICIFVTYCQFFFKQLCQNTPYKAENWLEKLKIGLFSWRDKIFSIVAGSIWFAFRYILNVFTSKI